MSQNQEAWITAHVNAYSFFGGVTRIRVPDNLKTGVIKNTRSETVPNKTYQEMAEHYGTAIIPARVKAPKDKATVEGSVGVISTWKIATVQLNYHISVDGQNYSVPFEHIKQKVDVRLTKNMIEVFFVCSHVRLPELLGELAIARGEGNYRKVVKAYKQVKLLILDEWLLYPLKETEARDLLEIVDGRCKKASTIFCSQFEGGAWHPKIGERTLADAICDRIVQDSYTIIIAGEDSMRKRKGIMEA